MTSADVCVEQNSSPNLTDTEPTQLPVELAARDVITRSRSSASYSRWSEARSCAVLMNWRRLSRPGKAPTMLEIECLSSPVHQLQSPESLLRSDFQPARTGTSPCGAEICER